MSVYLRAGLCLLLLLFCNVLPAWAAGGVQGRVAWRGELVPEVRVRAYRTIADIALGKELAVSAPSDLDGTYRLELPPGDYFLTARDYDDAPQPGRHFCYYSGAPVRVVADTFTNVGFNLVRIPIEAPPQPGETTGIQGEISYQDEPLEQCYLYVYKEADKAFKGPAYFIQPVAKGNFRLRLPPGDYYLLARKRAKGGQFGPIEIGDHFNYYYGNPVRIEPGQLRNVRIETITRLSMLEEGETPVLHPLTGRIVAPRGQSAAGLRVFAYRQPETTGTPERFSAPADAEGRFDLSLPDAGPWYLLARQHFGGPADEGEWFGRYGGATAQAVLLNPEPPNREVLIHVERKTLP